MLVARKVRTLCVGGVVVVDLDTLDPQRSFFFAVGTWVTSVWVSLPLICLLRTDISSKFIHTLHFDDGGNIFNITSRTISRGFCISFLAFQFGDLRFNMLISFRLQSHTPHYAIRERTNRNKTCKQNTETLKNDVTEPAELHKQKTHTREISRRAHSVRLVPGKRMPSHTICCANFTSHSRAQRR